MLEDVIKFENKNKRCRLEGMNLVTLFLSNSVIRNVAYLPDWEIRTM